MKRILISFAILLAITSSACKIFSSKTQDKVSTVPLPTEMIDNDWEKALALSRETNKPIYIEFYAKWCGYCKKFKANTLNDDEVKKYLSENYVPIVIDAEEGVGVELKNKYAINGYPTHVVVDVNQNQKAIIAGYMQPNAFLSWIKEIK